MSSQITHAQLTNKRPFANILGTCALISAVASFLQFTPTASNTSLGDKLPEDGRAVRKN